ncbi:MAG: RNA polymerase sigma factor [Ardenticatenaceae bacterium]|nr:RNA polymerase sigma factor [Ardenticatenaceae bacterium]MCB9443189.1 RNA polymerase sigma factor [Ardenticatenaceae bacterium]
MTGMALDAPERLRRQEIGADIEALVYTYYDAIYRLALSILADADEAEDAAQETFIAADRALAQYRGQSSVKTWLFAIAINQCRHMLRQRQRRQTITDAWRLARILLPRPALPEETMTHTETGDLLRQAVAELKEKHRLPIILRYAHDLTAPEIAQILQISEGTVHSRLHYARRELKQKLETGS